MDIHIYWKKFMTTIKNQTKLDEARPSKKLQDEAAPS